MRDSGIMVLHDINLAGWICCISPCSWSAGNSPILPAKHNVVGGIFDTWVSQQQRYNMLRWHICHTSALGAKRRTSKWVQHIKRCRDRDIRCTLYGGLAGLELANITSLTRDDPIFFSTLTWGWRWQVLSPTLSSEALQPLFLGPRGVTEHSVSESSPESVKGGLTPWLIHIS